MAVAMAVAAAMTATAVIQFVLGFFETLSNVADNLADVADAVKVQLELVDLTVDLPETLNLGVCIHNHLACFVIHHLSRNLRLFTEVVHLLGDVVHHTLKVHLECGK